MTREEILNKIAVKEFDCLFNEIVQLTNRVLVLNMGFNELLKQINDLRLGNVISIYVCGYCGNLLDDNNYPLKIQKEVPANAIKIEGSCCIMKERLYSSV